MLDSFIPAGPSESSWLTSQEAAAYLKCSRNFLDKDRLTRLHNIPFSRLGRHIRYNRADLDAFLEHTKEAGHV